MVPEDPVTCPKSLNRPSPVGSPGWKRVSYPGKTVPSEEKKTARPGARKVGEEKVKEAPV